MEHKEFSFRSHNTNFYGQYWQPEKVKAIVVLVHGMGGHSGRYLCVVEKLLMQDFAVIAYDNFGHGKTSGKRGHNPSFEALLDVIGEVISIAYELFQSKPLFLYGHSMGGNLVINCVLRRQFQIKGVIATSPFLKLAFQPPKWKMFLGKILHKVAPSVTLGNEIDANHVSRNVNEVNKYITDPLVHNKISPNYSLSIIDAGQWAIESAGQLQIEMFVAHGIEDKIIDYKGSVAFTEKTKLASLKLYKDSYHELHNDFCKDVLLEDVVSWVGKQL